MTKLSVIIPTLNCAPHLPDHIKSMESWLDLADEVIAVDSDSTDGTPDILKNCIVHHNLKVINHPRGLYQSWNHAIANSSGEWIYISTIGDSITRGQLLHLLETGEKLNADVVVSPPKFVFDEQISMETPDWPVHSMIDFYEIKNPIVISSLASFMHAMDFSPNGILGSSASNLYRGNHLRGRPFPTCFRMAGDTGWGIRHALETRFCYTPRVGSTFRFHSETYTSPDHEANKLLTESLFDECSRVIEENRENPNREILRTLSDLIQCKQQCHEAREAWGLARRSSFVPWYFRASAIRIRMRRNRLRIQLAEQAEKLEGELKSLPIEIL